MRVHSEGEYHAPTKRVAGGEGTPTLEARAPLGSEGICEDETPQSRALELVGRLLKMVKGAEKTKGYFTSNKVRQPKDLRFELREHSSHVAMARITGASLVLCLIGFRLRKSLLL